MSTELCPSDAAIATPIVDSDGHACMIVTGMRGHRRFDHCRFACWAATVTGSGAIPGNNRLRCTWACG